MSMQHYDPEENDKFSAEELAEDNSNDLDQAPSKRNDQLSLRRRIEDLLEEKRLRLELEGYDHSYSNDYLNNCDDNMYDL